MLEKPYLPIIFFHFFFLFFTASENGYSQPNRLQFTKLTPDDGLSTSIITSVFQDHKGLIWIGTSDGLNRYDGFRFTIYKNDPADSNSLADNVVQTIFEDHNKDLFIGTENGLCLYDRQKDQFRNYMHDKTSPLNEIVCTVSKIEEDSLENLWLATTAGLLCFDRTKNTVVQYANVPGAPGSLSNNNVESVLIDKKGRLWATTHKGLNLFLPGSRSFRRCVRIENSSEDISNTIFRSLAEDHDGNIWIGSREGLYCLKFSANDTIIKLVRYVHNSRDKTSLTINQVRSLYVDRAGNVWVGTENGGINLFDRKSNGFMHYRKDDYDPESLSNESIEAICEDRSGNLWFGTYTGGLNIAMKNRGAIIKYQNLPGAPFSLSHNTVNCFFEDHKDRIWIGTDGGGLNLFDEQNSKFKRFNMDNTSLTSNSVLCITEDSNRKIWLGTWVGGLVRFDPESDSFKTFKTNNCGIQDDNIFAVSEGFNNDLWLGSFEHGLIHYQIKENKFSAFTPQNSGVGNEMIVKILKCQNNRLLIGTTENFQIFSTTDGHFITYAYDPRNNNSLSYPRVTDIVVQNDSCIWIGTPDGLNRFNPVTNSFTRYYEKDGLPNNFIKGLILDKSGILWVTTNSGICRFDYRRPLKKNFTKADGLQSNEFSERSVLKTRNGDLFLGGIKGFNIVYPEKISENITIPDVLITDFKIFNKSIKPGIKNSPLSKNITETKSLVLPYDMSVLSFSFAVMDFSAPGKNQYAYMMENFDKAWIYPENRSDVTYTNLNPGNYVFRVKGSNNDGLWNEAGTSIEITIMPPWWGTWWFRITGFIIIILSFFSIFLWRVRQLQKQKEQLEINVELKTSELKELNASKDKFFSIIAHDLKNPFSTIIGFSELLNEDIDTHNDEKIREYTKLIHTSAVQTFRLLENLLEWANSQRGNLPFEPVNLNLHDLLNEELGMLNDMAVEKNIEIQNTVSENMTIIADRNMIMAILRNLISNAIKFTHRNGRVVVSSVLKNGLAEISVADTGIGMSDDTFSKLFRIDANLSTRGTENEKGTGLGLFLCKEFVERHGGRIWVESKKGNGSVFRFAIPAV
jgi:signal transduction histidine kinase/ligand-binding sensor domain-containing protein